MAIEDHPLFLKWKDRLEELIDAKEGLREGRTTQADVEKAQKEYDKIAEEI